MSALTQAHKEALKQFRQRHRGVAEAAKEHAVTFRRQRKALETALRAGPATVPRLAEQTGLSAEIVLWHVAGMRKYGRVRESGQEGDYILYAYVPADKTEEAADH